MLVRLLYASRAVDTSPAAIEAILTQSRQHNPGSGITGILCYGGGVFLQAIEGGRSAVNELYGHIQRDPRHKSVELLHYEEIAERRFGGWTMGQVNLSKLNHSILLKILCVLSRQLRRPRGIWESNLESTTSLTRHIISRCRR